MLTIFRDDPIEGPLQEASMGVWTKIFKKRKNPKINDLWRYALSMAGIPSFKGSSDAGKFDILTPPGSTEEGKFDEAMLVQSRTAIFRCCFHRH